MIRTIVQLVLVDETGDSYYRMRWPGAELVKQNPELRVINLDAQARERIRLSIEADLLVLIQNSDLDLLPVIEERRKLGKRTLIEYNDNYYEPPAWSPVAEPWSSPLIWQTYETLMRAGDALMVTGPGLEALFRPHTSVPIHIIENDFPRDLPPFEMAWREPKEKLRIGWAGSLGHMADLLAVQPVFKQLLDEFPHLTISLMGNESIPDVLRLPAGRFEFTPWAGMQEYLNFWIPIQIGIAPLLDTGYNRCRSDIKAIEMTAMGTLPILQRALPYEKFIAATGVPFFRNHQELVEILREFIRDPEKIQGLARTTYEYVRKNRVSSARRERLELYGAFLRDVPPSEFQWPLPPGYHEVKGTPEPESITARVLRELQQVINQGQRELALAKLKEIVAQNPGHPDLQLALFKLNLRSDRERALDLAPLLRRQFPRDARFLLSQLAAESDPGKVSALVGDLAAQLQKFPERSREVFRKEVLAVTRSLATRLLISSKEASLLSALYPVSPELHLFLAELLEREGEFAQAAELYERITRDFLIAEAHDAFRKGASYGFLRAWADGLKGR